MTLLQKWNYNTREYEPFNSPADNTYLYTADMQAPVDCAECGLTMTYGDGYTSRTIHNHFGMGYPVCSDCYELEWEAEKAAKNEL